MAGRSDAKGPEPNCVAMGLMPDTGKRLASIRVESTGGIYVHSISTRDYLNMCSESTAGEPFENAFRTNVDAVPLHWVECALVLLLRLASLVWAVCSMQEQLNPTLSIALRPTRRAPQPHRHSLGPARPYALDDGDDTNLDDIDDDAVAVAVQAAQTEEAQAQAEAAGERLVGMVRIRGGGCAASKPRAQSEPFIQDLDVPPRSSSLAVQPSPEASPEDVHVTPRGLFSSLPSNGPTRPHALDDGDDTNLDDIDDDKKCPGDDARPGEPHDCGFHKGESHKQLKIVKKHSDHGDKKVCMSKPACEVLGAAVQSGSLKLSILDNTVHRVQSTRFQEAHDSDCEEHMSDDDVDKVVGHHEDDDHKDHACKDDDSKSEKRS
jgi:hypothetical protein